MSKRRTWRPPTYHASERLVSLALLLAASPYPLKRSLIVSTLGISERTFFRYLGVLRGVLGATLVERDGTIALSPRWRTTPAVPAHARPRAA